MKILLCEDDANIATIAKLALEQIGQHEVTWVADGNSALDKGLNEQYDVILLDDMMPKMSGVNVCAAYVENGLTETPVIFMSANPQEKSVEQFKPVAIGYIPKPFDPMDLNKKIEDFMRQYQKAS